MHLHRCFLLALAVFPFGSIALPAQPVDIDLEFGILAGSPQSTLVNNLSGLANSFTRTEFERSPYTVGPAVGVIVADRIAVELSVLYRPLNFRSSSGPTSFAGDQQSSTVEAGVWEFPLLARYRFLSGAFRPFAGGGINLGTRVRGEIRTRYTDFPTGEVTTTQETYDRVRSSQDMAWILHGDIELRTSRLTFRPELRYARWENPPQRSVEALPVDEWTILVGIFLTGIP